MISYIKGELVALSGESVIVEVGGMGYEVRMPLSNLDRLPRVGSDIKIHTYLQMREDFIGLFGFLTLDYLETFKLLITVNGIGPKAALGVLSALTPDDLRFAVLANDVKTLTRAPGIGAKTASKLILELKDKMKLEDAFEQKLMNQVEGQMQIHNTGTSIIQKRNEAVQALEVLGYSGTEAAKMVRGVEITEVMTIEDIIKLSFKSLM